MGSVSREKESNASSASMTQVTGSNVMALPVVLGQLPELISRISRVAAFRARGRGSRPFARCYGFCRIDAVLALLFDQSLRIRVGVLSAGSPENASNDLADLSARLESGALA